MALPDSPGLIDWRTKPTKQLTYVLKDHMTKQGAYMIVTLLAYI